MYSIFIYIFIFPTKINVSIRITIAMSYFQQYYITVELEMYFLVGKLKSGKERIPRILFSVAVLSKFLSRSDIMNIYGRF